MSNYIQTYHKKHNSWGWPFTPQSLTAHYVEFEKSYDKLVPDFYGIWVVYTILNSRHYLNS